MDYIAPFQTYHVPNYHIILNTIPKFREGTVVNFDVNSVDDCLLRHLGHEEERIKNKEKNLRNPFIWFRWGFQEILSIPIYFLGWFGIFNSRTIERITNNIIFKLFSGIIALVIFISSIVTIIQGKEATIEYLHHFIGK